MIHRFGPCGDSPGTQTILQGIWNQEAREKWDEYDLSKPDTLARYGQTLRNMLSIAIVVPDLDTNRLSSIYLMDLMEQEDIDTIRLDMPGGHCCDGTEPERFIAMAEQIFGSTVGSGPSISPQGSMTVTWGAIKQGH